MKKLYPISHQSALQFWRSADHLKYLNKLKITRRNPVDLPLQYSCSAGHESLSTLHKTLNISYPITLMQPSKNCNFRTTCVRTVIRPKHIPPASFIHLKDDIIIASPEYCFLSLSTSLSFEKLVETANNLCSMYLKDSSAEHGQITAEAICTVELIKEFLNNSEKIKGIFQARSAIKYAVNNCNSPIESKLAVIFCLPKVRGGYGFKKMKMNLPVLLCESAGKLVNRKELVVDMVWPKEKVIVEYDSDETHLSSGQHAFDKSRVNALNLSGYRVITITKKDFSSLRSLDAISDVIRKALGLRSNKTSLEKYYDIRKKVLINLFYKS